MNIDDFKTNWQNAGDGSYSEKEIEMMTKISSHPTLKKIRIKLLAEAVMLTALLFGYYDGFDGINKPLYINVFLVMSICLYILNNVAGYIFIKTPATEFNIKLSLYKQVTTLKRVRLFSLFSSAFYAISLLAFFMNGIRFTNQKYMIVAAAILIYLVLFILSYLTWKRKIDHFRRLEEEF
jgi:phosphoglycerol transferase MdoB-like AlkP superfamily enzyme